MNKKNRIKEQFGPSYSNLAISYKALKPVFANLFGHGSASRFSQNFFPLLLLEEYLLKHASHINTCTELIELKPSPSSMEIQSREST